MPGILSGRGQWGEHRAAQAPVGYVPLRNMDSDHAEKQMAGEKDFKHPLAVIANTGHLLTKGTVPGLLPMWKGWCRWHQ